MAGMLLARAACLCLVMVGEGCGSLPQASRPPLPSRSAPLERRHDVYERYKLQQDRGLLSSTWHRDDGSYAWAELEGLAEPYPRLHRLRHRAALKSTLLGALGIAGLTVLVGTAGHELAARPGEDFPGDVERTLYITGAAAFFSAVLLRFLIPDPRNAFADAYNDALRNDLGLSR